MRVLTKDVTACGRLFPEGTDVEELPLECRDSVIGTGWTRSVMEARDPDVDRDPPAAEQGGPPQTTEPPAPPPASEEASETEQPIVENVAVEDSLSIESLGLSDKLRDLLTAQGLRTAGDMIRFRDQNGSFRVIKGIAKAGDEQINAVLPG